MRVGLLWYAAHDNEPGEVGRGNRLAPLSTAIRRYGFDPVAIPYRHTEHEAAARMLMDCSAVMTWVNSIEDGRDRSRLDELLHELEQSGAVVSASHEARRRIGTKAVVHAKLS